MLVGKGITFDTGGLAVKPREAMLPMRTDMSGAGAVLAVLAACRAAGVRRRVVGLLPLAENAVGGRVVPARATWSGSTAGAPREVVNTDAEGRVVLADAMAWADEHLDPDLVVDVATLTGAASLGLGRRHAALYSPDDDLAAALAAAAAAAGEQVWRMPLVEDYRAGDRLRGGRRPAGRDRARVRRRLDHRRAVPARVRRRPAAGRTSTSPGRPAPTGTSTRCPRGATGFGARAAPAMAGVAGAAVGGAGSYVGEHVPVW